ncbi:uncharacterized protein [Nicotiana sylvestris]|uniref:uncharacterized protein n=1 Tax=Nicotiana sylvestris TaxID=4096 RepID=UPI00388C940A
MQGLGGQVSIAYKDLCLFPHVQLPVGFKMPNFDLYDGHGYPVAHLRGLCSKMRGVGGKDELLMTYISQSLSGAALEWYTRQDHSRWYTWDDLAQAFTRYFQYNIEIVLDCLSLTKIEKKPSESFREYGFHWREQAARVNPPMEENEMVEYFLQALEPTYFGHLISTIGKSFNEVVKMGGMVEEGLKSSKIISYTAIKATTQSPEAPNINQNPLSAHAEMHMIEIVHKDWKPKKPSQPVMMIRSSEIKSVKDSVFTKATSLLAEGSTEKLSMPNDTPIVVVKKRPPSDVIAKQEKPKVQDYSIIEQLRKTPAQISLLSLLIHSDEHRQAVMKILNEAHVPEKITVNHLEKIANKIFESNRITFFDDDLPLEGMEHNQVLYLTVKCDESIVTRVLVDNGSSANICPLSTLNKLKVDDERIHKNSICI